VEQDHLLGRNEPLSRPQTQAGLLLLAHGERLDGQSNDDVTRLAADIAARNFAAETRVGFIAGTPQIAQALQTLTAEHVVAYPLFMADGHFLRIAVNSLRTAAEAGRPRRVVTVLPPLGAEPTLANLIAAKAEAAACAQGLSPAQTTLILVAHGSKRGNASRRATEMVADRLRDLTPFAAVTGAYLDEPPALGAALESHPGPAVVVGMFVGHGLHARIDLPRLLASLPGRTIAFAGHVGGWRDISDVVADGLQRALQA
jgi:sirohydrochlorin cobaltochelatase